MGIKVEDHLKLVMHIAKRYDNRKETTIDDIFQEGCIGLMRAANEYDESKGVPFSSFAGQYIQFYIIRYLKGLGLIRKPINAVELAAKILKLGIEGKKPEEIAKQLDTTKYRVGTALEIINERMCSLDKKIKGKDDKSRDLIELVKVDNYDPYEDVLNRMVINSPGFKVSDDESMVLEYTYDLYTQDEIAEMTRYKDRRNVSVRLSQTRKKFRSNFSTKK